MIGATLLALGLTLPLADEEMPVVYQTEFLEDSLEGWRFSDANAWRIVSNADGDKALGLVARSRYRGKVRSPYGYALIENVSVTDFVLDLRVRSTTRDYNHRDLCVFFGFQDAEHFYYVHLGKRADPHAHSIFLVNGRDRVSIAKERTTGVDWDDQWHDVRIVRDTGNDSIEVYFDDMDEPIMRTTDDHFESGLVGVGSFDDQGEFDSITLRGKLAD